MTKYVNSKNNSENWKAVKEFTDREEPRKVFWDTFEEKRNNKDEIKVITYYGIGGIGKSTLLRKLISELEEKNQENKYAIIDFENFNGNVFDILRYLENNLKNKYKFSFPIFDLVAYTYEIKMGKNATKPELLSIFDENTELSFLKDVINEIPLIGTISKIIYFSDKAKNLVQTNLKSNKIKMELKNIDNMSSSEIYSKLPYYFAMDMQNNVEKLDYPFVFFIDTYEKLVNELESHNALDNDYFLRGDDGIILNVPNVIWVIAGREKIKWETFDQEWAESINQHLLGNLSLVDTTYFLKKAGIPEALINDLYDLTLGAPKYLDICVDTYASLINQNKTPKITDFGKNTTELQKRYLIYMGDIEKDFVTMLAFLPSWTDENIEDISKTFLGSFSPSLYEKVKDFSFIQNENGIYTINASFKDVIMNNASEAIRNKYFKLLEKYIDKEIEEITIKNNITDKKINKNTNIDNYNSKNSFKNIIFASIKELNKVQNEEEFVNKARFIIKKIEEYEKKYEERICFNDIDLYISSIFSFSNTLEYKILLGFKDLVLNHVINNFNMSKDPYHVKRFIENCEGKITDINLYKKLEDIVINNVGKNSLYYAKLMVLSGENISKHETLETTFNNTINSYTGTRDNLYIITILEGYTISNFKTEAKLEEIIDILKQNPNYLTVKVLKNILKINPNSKEEKLTFDYIFSIKNVVNETLDVNIIDGIYNIVTKHLDAIDSDPKALELLTLLKSRYEEMYGSDSIKVNEASVYLFKDNIIYNSKLYYQMNKQAAEKYGYSDPKTIKTFNLLTKELGKNIDYLKNFTEEEREYFLGNLQSQAKDIINSKQTADDDIREMLYIIYEVSLKFCNITENPQKKKQYMYTSYELLKTTLKYYDDKEKDTYQGCGYFFKFYGKITDIFAQNPKEYLEVINKLYNEVQHLIIDNKYSNKNLEIILIKIIFTVVYANTENFLNGMVKIWGIKNYEWFMKTQTDGSLDDLKEKHKKGHYYAWYDQVFYILMHETAKFVLANANNFYNEYKEAAKKRSRQDYSYKKDYIKRVSELASYIHKITLDYKKNDFYYYTWLYTEGLISFISGSKSSLHNFDNHKKIVKKFKKHPRLFILEDLYETKNTIALMREVDKNDDWTIFA